MAFGFLFATSAIALADDTKPKIKSADNAQAVAASVEGTKAKIPQNIYASQFEILMKECGVEESKADQLQSLLKGWDVETVSIVGSVPPENPDLIAKLEAIDKELLEANKANDAAQVRALSDSRREIQDLMDGWTPELRKHFDDVNAKYRGAVRDLAAPDKVDRLDEILDATQDVLPHRARRGPVRSPRALKAIVDRLGDLTPEQRRSVDGLFEQFREAQRGTAGREHDKDAATRKLYDDVFAVLTDGQKTRVEQQLAGRTGTAAPAAPKDPAAPPAGAPANAPGNGKPAVTPTPPAKPDTANP